MEEPKKNDKKCAEMKEKELDEELRLVTGGQNNTVLNWETFDIREKKTVKFDNQPQPQ